MGVSQGEVNLLRAGPGRKNDRRANAALRLLRRVPRIFPTTRPQESNAALVRAHDCAG